MITKTTQSDELIRYLERDKYVNLNILGYLQYDKDADVYLFNDDLTHGVIVGSKEQDPFFLATDHLDFLKEFWELLPLGDKCFSAVPKNIALLFLRDKETTWQSPCKVYALQGALEETQSPACSVYQDESLTIEDAEEVDRHYTYRWEESILFMRENILLRDSSCIRMGGELAAWCCVHAEDNSMGPLYTKKAYRSRGLAELVSLRLMRKLIAKGITPYVQIHEDNHASLQLIKKIPGMAHSHDCVWFGVEK